MKKVIFFIFRSCWWLCSDSSRPDGRAVAATPGERLAARAVQLWPETGDSSKARWTYDEGVMWKGMEGLWLNTGNAYWFKYVQHQMDRLVNKEGEIRTYKLEDYNLDNVLCGRVLLMLYKVTGQEKYYKAAGHLRDQLRTQPRTLEGSYWHKKKYVEQVWLDGLYMAQPFLRSMPRCSMKIRCLRI
ncbi:glycoside hydrolase family 88 protein [Puia sp. P3]|uniref:glycoside hydrolase family 88 protein n=1 Tax=Puia sp. P3 TaxID=3423952 RepID=UPI003D67C739